MKYLDFGSFKRYNKEIKIGSAISCEDGSNTTSNKVVKPFTVATTRGFSTLNSRKVSIQIRRKLSSLWFDIATSDLANATGKASPVWINK